MGPHDWDHQVGDPFRPLLEVVIRVGRVCEHVCICVGMAMEGSVHMAPIPGHYYTGHIMSQIPYHLLTRPSRGWSFRVPILGRYPQIGPFWTPLLVGPNTKLRK